MNEKPVFPKELHRLRPTPEVVKASAKPHIPKDSILRYETALKSGEYVVIAHGSDVETVHAREIISRTNPEALEEHQPAGASTVGA